MSDPLQEDLGLIRVHTVCIAMRAVWRPTPCHDIGIDGQVEFLEHATDFDSTGKIVAVQVKSGPSFFKHADGNDFKYYPSAKHVRYWRGINLPVLLVLHNPDTGVTIYTDVKTQLDGPIRVSKHQTLTGASRDDILAICDRLDDQKRVLNRQKLIDHELGYEEQPEIVEPELTKAEATLDSFGDTWFETKEGQQAFDAYSEVLQRKQAEHFIREVLPTLPADVRDQRLELVNGVVALLQACRDCDSWDDRSEYKLISWLEHVPEEMLPYTSLPNLLKIQQSLLQYLKVHQDMNADKKRGYSGKGN